MAQDERYRCEAVQVLSSEEKSKITSPEDYDIYQSELFYAPYKAEKDFLKFYQKLGPYSLVSAPRCWILYSAIKQAMSLGMGEYWECGVYRGGTAFLLRMMRDELAPERTIRLFDSFEGMPDTDEKRDFHKAGDFADTSLDGVRSLVGVDAVKYHAGFIPQTFEDIDVDRIAFAHIDLDLHDAIYESCKFIYPKLSRGGVLVFDDYGFPSCPGARIAVDEFFSDKPETPMVLPTAQAVVHKL